MTDPSGRRRILLKSLTIASVAAYFAAAGAIELCAKLETWRQDSAAAFGKHRREGVVVSDQGRIRLGRALVPTAPLNADRVWDLARAADGSIYAATGDSGQVYRMASKDAAAWELVLDHPDGQALSLAATPDGKVYAGTGPTGKVVELTDPKHPESRPAPDVLYIWDLAADAAGNLYAATGPNGQLWKRSPDGAWTLAYDAKPAHLLSVAVGPDGSAFAGSDGEGLIFRLAPDGKTSVLYDAPQSEVRTLFVASDGALYAGTAAEAVNKGLNLFSTTTDPSPRPVETSDRVPLVARRVRTVSFAQEEPKAPSGGSAAPKPAQPGENAVYRIDKDGVAREVFRARALIFAVAKIDDRLLIGTGPEGLLYEVREAESENAPIARLDNGQILALLAEPGGGLLIGAGDPGAVVRLSSEVLERGEMVSDVFDARLPSRFGSLGWQGETPEGTSIALQVRTGNVGETDATWSPWSAEQSDPKSAQADAPVGRFVQYRARLATRDPKRSPELRAVSVAYRSINLHPEIAKLELPDVADGAAKQAKINIRWEVTDPNDDEMNYVVQARKEGWPTWIALTESPITEKSYAWDATAFPSGRYQVKVIAGDRPSNGPDEALSRDRESVAFLVDHEAPKVEIAADGRKATIRLGDDLTRLVKAEYAVDGGAWSSIFPDDGLFDSTSEKSTLNLPDLKPGVHLLMIRATDAAGNVGSGDALLTVKD